MSILSKSIDRQLESAAKRLSTDDPDWLDAIQVRDWTNCRGISPLSMAAFMERWLAKADRTAAWYQLVRGKRLVDAEFLAAVLTWTQALETARSVVKGSGPGGDL